MNGGGADVAGLLERGLGELVHADATPPGEIDIDKGELVDCWTTSWGEAARWAAPDEGVETADEGVCWQDEVDETVLPVTKVFKLVGGLAEIKVDGSLLDVIATLDESNRYSRGRQSVLTKEKSRNSSWFIAFTIIGSICVRTGSSDVKSLSKLLVSFSSF